MLTKDPMLIKWFNPPYPPRTSDRVYGFLCGYVTTLGHGKDHEKTEEYRQGWEEGKSLRFDEMKAAHAVFVSRRAK